MLAAAVAGGLARSFRGSKVHYVNASKKRRTLPACRGGAALGKILRGGEQESSDYSPTVMTDRCDRGKFWRKSAREGDFEDSTAMAL